MFSKDHPHKTPLFDYYSPNGSEYIGILSIPHSGEIIPEEFKTYLSGIEQDYKEDVDFKVNELVDIPTLQKAGIAILVANIHRICVDLNRDENNSVLFWKQNTHGRPLVVKEPSVTTINDFIGRYHRPYFEVLKTAILELQKIKAGPVSMIDLHSMPSKPTAYHLKQNPNQKDKRPEFCLSDRRGKTCTPEFINFYENELKKHHYTTSINDPYIGGYVTEYVDQFRTNNIQIEINRAIYMDENSKNLIPSKVNILKDNLTNTLITGFKHFNS